MREELWKQWQLSVSFLKLLQRCEQNLERSNSCDTKDFRNGHSYGSCVDTGSAVSIISQTTLDKYLRTYTLEDTDTRLKPYSREQIRPV